MYQLVGLGTELRTHGYLFSANPAVNQSLFLKLNFYSFLHPSTDYIPPSSSLQTPGEENLTSHLFCGF